VVDWCTVPIDEDVQAPLTAPTVDRAIPEPKARAHLVDLPEPLGYRIKNRVLGPPLHTDQLAHERLGKPTALAVFASDNLSSSAYATEEFLRVLVPAAGLALAFQLILPLTIAMLVVLALLILSYRQTIKAYPSAGGAYIVVKDNFGEGLAQVAGVSLLIGYVLTAAVSVAAGAAALASAFEDLAPFVLPISIVFLLIIGGGNLKGVKESGKAFAVPTYFFIVNMFVLLAVGAARMLGAFGGIQKVVVEEPHEVMAAGAENTAMFMGVGLIVLMRAFASGGAAVTGVEAISNGVPAFKEPSWKNARDTLVIMGSLLGVMFFGLSILAAQVEAVPYLEGTPTVISQVGEAIYNSHHSGFGFALWLSLQAGTMLILVLAANTSYADFPRLASFQAGDNFMPRQLVKRGHRLVFSNGIVTLTVVSALLLVFTGAKVEKLIPMYAIGVFTGFALSQAGMAKRHTRLKQKGWRIGFLVNGVGALISIVVLLVAGITKFTEGAWVVIVIIPLSVIPLFRLNKQYAAEENELESDAATAIEAPIKNRHVVIVLIDKLDMAASRAVQYARALTPDDLRAVHFDLDPIRTKDIGSSWSRLGFSRLPLDIVECPDRRLERAAAEIVARELLDDDTEVSVLLPRREYSQFWHRFLHDRTADSIAETLSTIPHCNVTIVPYHLSGRPKDVRLVGAAEAIGDDADDASGDAKTKQRAKKARAVPTMNLGDFQFPENRTPIKDLQFRQRARVAGKVYSMRVQPWSGVAALELNLIDDTGALTVVFFGRRHLAGVNAGTAIAVEGVIGEHRGTMAMLNPAYEIQFDPHAAH